MPQPGEALAAQKTAPITRCGFKLQSAGSLNAGTEPLKYGSGFCRDGTRGAYSARIAAISASVCAGVVAQEVQMRRVSVSPPVS